MADASLFALDITDDSVAGVLFAEGKRATEILASHCRFLDRDTDAAAAIGEVVEHCQARGSRSLVSLAAANFYFRTFRLPFTDRKKIASVLPFEIQDAVSFADESFIFDHLVAESEDGQADILAVLAKKKTIREWLDLLLEYELDPELLTVSGFAPAFNICRYREEGPQSLVLLQVGFTSALLTHISDRTIRTVRTLGYNVDQRAEIHYSESARSVKTGNPPEARQVLERLTVDVHNTLLVLNMDRGEEETIPLGITGLVGHVPVCRERLLGTLPGGTCDTDWQQYVEVEKLEEVRSAWPAGALEQVLALACLNPKDRERINFRKDEFAWGDRVDPISKSLKLGAIGALVLLVLVTGYQLFTYRQLANRADRFDRQIAELYQQTIPGGTVGREPLKTLQVKVNELKETTVIGSGQDPSVTTLSLLADISARIPTSPKVSFERYIYDRKSIRVRGLTENFNAVDAMKKELEKSPYFQEVAIGSANIAPKEQGVRFELNLEL